MKWLRRNAKPEDASLAEKKVGPASDAPDGAIRDPSEKPPNYTPPKDDGETIVQEHEKTPVDVPAGEIGGDAAQADLAKTTSADDVTVYPTGLRLTVIIVSLCFAIFLVALDQTIIATAMYVLLRLPSYI
jgi:hypothetical protein